VDCESPTHGIGVGESMVHTKSEVIFRSPRGRGVSVGGGKDMLRAVT
jgi:hypothetical protein